MSDMSMEAAGSALHVMPPSALAERPRAVAWTLTACFSATLFTSAALLFTVEPMFAKMVLPRLGGSPAVWNTCVLFFQAAMLAGYAYAHVTSRRLTLGRQAALHVGLTLVAAFTLPVAIPADWAPPVDRTPIPALLALLLATLGPPFFVMSSTAPLLQKWFSQTDHPSARDPYFLYASSNLGSISALLAYPFVIEPRLRLADQSSVWTLTYVLCAALTLFCVWTVMSRPRTRQSQHQAVAGRPEVVSWTRRARWLVLAFVPSSLMLGVTTFLSTDVAAMPLLWTIPLALYLLTFVIAFASRSIIPVHVTSRVALVLVLAMIALFLAGIVQPAWLLMPIHLAGFFAAALLLHGELSRDRPSAHNLTEFYLWISIGGLLGGVFNTLLAPVLFSSVLEYPLVLAMALTLRPEPPGAESHSTPRDLGLAITLGTAITIGMGAVKNGALGSLGISAAVGVIGILFAMCAKRPFRLGMGVAFVVLGTTLLGRSGEVLHAERTFYGVMRVTSDRDNNRHRLLHGSTLHGEQNLEGTARQRPLTYFHPTGPIGQALAQVSHRFQRVGVIGLGAGSLAAYALPGQTWTFFEIDPAVARIAANPRWFTFLSACGKACTVVLGDARLSMAARDDTYDLIVLDAFSSDAIPAHLLTREALSLYLSRLSHQGLIAFHISNRHLDLRPVVASLAAERGLVTRAQLHRPPNQSEARTSLWIVASRTADALGPLASDPRWLNLTVRSQRVWSDDYSDILSVLRPPT